MAGGDKRYEGGLAMNSIEFFKVSTISMGVTNPVNPYDYTILTYQDVENYQYRKIVLDTDGCLVGAVLVGDVDRAGIFSGLIKNRVNVTSFEDSLLLPDFGFIHLTSEIRKQLFGERGYQWPQPTFTGHGGGH